MVGEVITAVDTGQRAGRRGDSDESPAFPLFSLPDELWSKICRLAATATDPIVIGDKLGRAHYQQKVSQPPITRVCRAIRNETIAAFYKNNHFIHDDRSGGNQSFLVPWLRRVCIVDGYHLPCVFIESDFNWAARHFNGLFKNTCAGLKVVEAGRRQGTGHEFEVNVSKVVRSTEP
ncbi:hypothetical protein LTR56_018985 [Elasticomyces elasticus]|nr:hypothetical protein LTR56_018985 [Elasticomyces elasticus]KAK3635547.1 hypothetical protein LTR22_019115 [Elasticomyces elasticus]KAK4911750.1 hypothetical protein LTR49_019740 [Elasticomyces elasticus]KAK5769787.1 hypothetical protein LTS12_000237 [Elasticomyces elasticus]